MAWWLLIPAGGYVAKKVYDAVKDGKASNHSKSVVSPTMPSLAAQKAIRTKARKAAIIRLVTQRRAARYECIQDIVNDESQRVGEVTVSQRDSESFTVTFKGIDAGCSALLAAKSVMGGELPSKPISQPHFIRYPSPESLAELLVKRANVEYGGMAGIDSQGRYQPGGDPFLRVLRGQSDGPM